MKNRILTYRRRIDKLLEECPDDTDWAQVLEEHLVQITFFQHERLVHLLVTLAFALLTILSFGIFLVTTFLPVLALIVLLLVLLIPYIGHYYLLENETQRMYRQYDTILQYTRKKKQE